MTFSYQILSPAALPAPTIQTILNLWQVEAWNGMDVNIFREQFSRSEFHLLTDAHGALRCIARVNHAFTLKIGEDQYTFAELVGLVAAQQGRGSGKMLMAQLCHNLRERNVQALGFCSRALRPFYEKCGVSILHDRARYIHEPAGAAWVPSEDDDILDLSLSAESAALLCALNEHNVAYLVC